MAFFMALSPDRGLNISEFRISYLRPKKVYENKITNINGIIKKKFGKKILTETRMRMKMAAFWDAAPCIS